MKEWGLRLLASAGVLFVLSLGVVLLNYFRGDAASNILLYVGILVGLPVLPLALVGVILLVIGASSRARPSQ